LSWLRKSVGVFDIAVSGVDSALLGEGARKDFARDLVIVLVGVEGASPSATDEESITLCGALVMVSGANSVGFDDDEIS
jgi:hypothetical protein